MLTGVALCCSCAASATCYPRTEKDLPGAKLVFPQQDYLQKASNRANVLFVAGILRMQARSGCPVNMALEVFGDRWSLLIVRDLMVRGFRTFYDFENSGEGIATNILADRLRNLCRAGIVEREPDETDRRRMNYRLTEKGIDLAPVLLEMLIWGARHEPSGAPCEVIAELAKNREAVIEETRRRWRERDPRPILPWLGGPVRQSRPQNGRKKPAAHNS